MRTLISSAPPTLLAIFGVMLVLEAIYLLLAFEAIAVIRTCLELVFMYFTLRRVRAVAILYGFFCFIAGAVTLYAALVLAWPEWWLTAGFFLATAYFLFSSWYLIASKNMRAFIAYAPPTST